MAIVVVDPGHGGTSNIGGSSWNNATGPLGTLEKRVTLVLSKTLRDELTERGHSVGLTRENDSNLSLSARAACARHENADVFVSIHCNGWHTPDVQGCETWLHTRHEENSAALARLLQRRLVAATGLTDRGVFQKNLGVLDPDRHNAHTAACLVEVSFLTDPAEEQRLNEPAYLRCISRHLAEAIDEYVETTHTRIDARNALVERDATATVPMSGERHGPSEAELWQRQQETAEAALRFAVNFLGCRRGPRNDQPLDGRAMARLRTVVRAVSIVESRHGTQGANQPARDPLQSGNPRDAWWRELTGQAGQGSRVVRGPGLSNVWANEVNAAAEATAGFNARAKFASLANPVNGHRNRSFVPSHSFVWGIIYLLHRINTTAGHPSFACGDLSRERLIVGAVSYNGGGVPDYRTRVERALSEIGDLPEAASMLVRDDVGALIQQISASAAAFTRPAQISRADFTFGSGGYLSSASFEFATEGQKTTSATYEVSVVRTDRDTGRLTFSTGAVVIDAVCWWDLHRKIAAGTYLKCSATRMTTKIDSVTREKRPGIYLPTAVAPDTGERTIFIHEGKDPAWSDGCIVLPRDQMMKIWNIIEKDARNVTVFIADA